MPKSTEIYTHKINNNCYACASTAGGNWLEQVCEFSGLKWWNGTVEWTTGMEYWSGLLEYKNYLIHYYMAKLLVMTLSARQLMQDHTDTELSLTSTCCIIVRNNNIIFYS